MITTKLPSISIWLNKLCFFEVVAVKEPGKNVYKIRKLISVNSRIAEARRRQVELKNLEIKQIHTWYFDTIMTLLAAGLS